MSSHLMSTIEGQEIIRAQSMTSHCIKQHGGYKDSIVGIRLTISIVHAWFNNMCYISVAIFTFLATLTCVMVSTGMINPGTPGYRNTYKKTFLVTYL